MRAKTTRGGDTADECRPEPVAWPGGEGTSPLPLDTTLEATKLRVARLARTIETEVIPRLVRQP